jgi:hypothetical protein
LSAVTPDNFLADVDAPEIPWAKPVTFSGKWHGFFSAMWRDRSGAWGRPFS